MPASTPLQDFLGLMMDTTIKGDDPRTVRIVRLLAEPAVQALADPALGAAAAVVIEQLPEFLAGVEKLKNQQFGERRQTATAIFSIELRKLLFAAHAAAQAAKAQKETPDA